MSHSKHCKKSKNFKLCDSCGEFDCKCKKNKFKALNTKLDLILDDLKNNCDVAEVVITPTMIGTTGYIINTPGKYCLAGYTVYNNTTTPAITVSASNVFLDLNGYTINLNNTAFAGVFISPGVGNVLIENGAITNSPQPLAPPNAQGFGIALGAGVFNILMRNIETDKCFVGIGTLDGCSNISIKDCHMYRFGFDYGANNYRGVGFLFSSTQASTTPSSRVYNLSMDHCIANSSTGQFAYGLRAVAGGYISNSSGQLGFNVPIAIAGTSEGNTEESRIFLVLGCDDVIIDNANTINGRNGIIMQNCNSCIVKNSTVSEYSRQGLLIANSAFPPLNVTPLNGASGQDNSIINCVAHNSIINPNQFAPFDANGADRGISISLVGVSNNIIDNCEGTGNLTGAVQAGLALLLAGGVTPSTQNIIRNCTFSHNTNGIFSQSNTNIRNHFDNIIINYNVTAGVVDPTNPNDNLYENNTANFNGPINAQSTNYSTAVRPVVNTTLVANSFTNPVAYYANRTNATGGAVNVP
jgi:hypothetical protein